MREAPRYMVRELSQRGLLRVEDGNHGEYRPRKHEFVENGVAFIRAADLGDAGIDFASASRINEVARSRITKGIGQPKDIILSHKGTIGKVAKAPSDAPPFVCSPQTTFWRSLDRETLDQEFLYAFIRSPDFRAQLDSRAGETDMAGYVSLTAQRTFWVSLPPIEIQKETVSCIRLVDKKIDLNRRMNETLEAIARAIFKDWFVDFGPTRAKAEGRAPYLAPELWDLFPDALDDEGKPAGWQGDVLGSFANLQNGYAFKSKDWRTSGVPVVKIGSVKPAFVDLDKVSFIDEAVALEKDNFRLSVGDMLVGLTGYVGETGRIPPTEHIPMLNQRVGKFVPRFGLESFVYSSVRCKEFREFAESKSHGSAQANVSTKELLSYPLLNPGEPIVRAFCNTTAPLFRSSLANYGQATVLGEVRDLLLPKLMSGEIRLRDAEKVIGAVT